MSQRVPLSEQIHAVEFTIAAKLETWCPITIERLSAALATLKWVERHQAELRVLGEFPIEKIEVFHADDTSAAASEKVTQPDERRQ
jgi:hypothetical protein